MTTSSPPTVIGLDLSLTATGVATPLGVKTITSKGKAGASIPERNDRLTQLRLRIDMAMVGYKPDLVVIEAPAFDSRTGHQHDRSGLWWGVVSWLLHHNVPVAEVTTGGLKKYATGKGNAGKDEVLAAVVRRYPDIDVSNNNEADALVLRAMGCEQLGHPLVDLPATHRAALTAVNWPNFS